MNFGTVYTNDPGSYLLVYLATNDLGLVNTIVRTVQVVDATPPYLALNGAPSMNVLDRRSTGETRNRKNSKRRQS